MEWEIFSYSESLEMRRPHCPPGDVLNPFLQLISPGMHTVANGLCSRLEDVGLVDPQVAFTLLRLCGGFCRLTHLALCHTFLVHNTIPQATSRLRVSSFFSPQILQKKLWGILDGPSINS